jgi:hypothetical protein
VVTPDLSEAVPTEFLQRRIGKNHGDRCFNDYA